MTACLRGGQSGGRSSVARNPAGAQLLILVNANGSSVVRSGHKAVSHLQIAPFLRWRSNTPSVCVYGSVKKIRRELFSDHSSLLSHTEGEKGEEERESISAFISLTLTAAVNGQSFSPFSSFFSPPFPDDCTKRKGKREKRDPVRRSH